MGNLRAKWTETEEHWSAVSRYFSHFFLSILTHSMSFSAGWFLFTQEISSQVSAANAKRRQSTCYFCREKSFAKQLKCERCVSEFTCLGQRWWCWFLWLQQSVWQPDRLRCWQRSEWRCHLQGERIAQNRHTMCGGTDRRPDWCFKNITQSVVFLYPHLA